MNKKIRKFISKGLIMSTLIVNIPSISLAGILSDDTRYETFEGSNITINNVLEESEVDITVEGNTLVNNILNPNKDGVTFKGSQRRYVVGKDTLIKSDTEYTIMFKISDLNLDGLQSINIQIEMIGGFGNHGLIIGKVDKNGLYKFKHTTSTKIGTGSILLKGLSGEWEGSTSTTRTLKISDAVILEGDWTDKEIPGYFEGLKSVGEQEDGKSKIIVKSQTKNLVSVNMFEKGNVEYGGAKNFYEEMKKTDYLNRLRLKDLIKVNPGEVYTVKVFDSTLNVGFQYFDENKKGIEVEPSRSGTQMTYAVPENAFYLNVYVATVDDQNVTNQQMDNFKCTLVKGNIPLNIYNEPHSDDVSVLLNNPLRGLPSGIKDRIIKKNGKWVIERNCGEIVLNGLNDYEYLLTGMQKNVLGVRSDSFVIKKNSDSVSNLLPISDVPIYSGDDMTEKNNTYFLGYADVNLIRIYISQCKTIDEYKQYLKTNPMFIVYELPNPYYEPIGVSLLLDLYKDVTCISSDSIIPANLKITVDRAANRAQEAIEAAKVTPTIENLSIARMWINLMQDSILKDEFQEDINNIIQVEDLEIEKKKVSANLDLYVKSENMLSMSLSTNSVTFENYSGVEDMELLNAVGIAVKSSLPYDLSAYIEDEISNKDKTTIIDVRTLNIRESSQSVYKQFNAIAEKLIIKDNCEAANDVVHSIDLKLSNDDTHKTDVYKTVIKFEIEQK